MSYSLRGGTAAYASAVLLDRVLGFLMLPFLTRAITPQDYGAWTQTAVTTGMLVALVVFAFPTAIVRYFSGSVGAAPRYFDRLGAICVALFALVVGLVLAGAKVFAAGIYGSPAAQALLPPLLLLLAAEAGFEFAMAWLRAAGGMGTVAGALMTRSVLRYGTLLALVGPGRTALVDWLGPYAWLQFVFAALVLVVSRAHLATSANTDSASPPALRELLRFSAPLVLLAGFTSLNAALDRYLLLHWLDLETVAVYAAAGSLAGIPMVFHSVLGFTLFPALARRWGERRAADAAALMSRVLHVYLFFCVPVVLTIALVGPWGLPQLATARYNAPLLLFALLGLSVIAFGIYQILLYALLLDGRSLQVLLLAIAATAINLVLNLMLAPRFAASGAAAAVAASNLVMALIAARLARSVMPWRFPWAGVRQIVWRSAIAALPLAGSAIQDRPSGALMLAAFVLGAALYLGLDLRQRGSILRSLLP